MKRILKIIASILLVSVVLLEYFVLFWFWAGDGLFTLIAIPAFFVLFLLAQLRLRKGTRTWTIGMILLTPILAICACYVLAWLWGIEIAIW